MASRHAQRGFTIVELLVVTAIMGIVMSLATTFFVQQSQLTRRTQARNEVQSKVRTVAEIAVQDLQIAGSSATVGETSHAVAPVSLPCSASSATKCLVGTDGGAKDSLAIFYATSLRTTDSCRKVSYTFAGTTLQRSDVACAAADAAYPVADNIETFNVTYLCASDKVKQTPGACYDYDADIKDYSFPRQATVTVSGRSDTLADVTAQVTLTTVMPNMKDR